jgi:mannose-1-phosphate guanylyltransferase
MYVVIMAGGRGTRFWPRSRAAEPKQLLNILSDRTMLQETLDRISGLVPVERVLIVTTREQAERIREQLPQVPAANIIIEPSGRNTAACICLAAGRIQREDPDACMCVLPADHCIADQNRFRVCVQQAADIAVDTNGLVAIGIVPLAPETGYGYMHCEPAQPDSRGCRVLHFHEKPAREQALRYIDNGDYLWNSGMFVWKASAILREIKIHLPDIYASLLPVAEAWGAERFCDELDRAYASLRSISIDSGVLEKAACVLAIRGEFGWSDVGSWSAVYDICTKDDSQNVLRGDVYTVDARRCLVQSSGKTVAVVGLDDVVIVETADALLVCRRDRAQDVRTLVEQLEKQGRMELL